MKPGDISPARPRHCWACLLATIPLSPATSGSASRRRRSSCSSPDCPCSNSWPATGACAVRILAIGEVQVTAKGEVHTQHHSYFARGASAEAFTRLALVETHQRGIENSPQVAAVMDGADWLQGFADHHCPRAVRILDFAHAAQRIGEIGQALFLAAPPTRHKSGLSTGCTPSNTMAPQPCSPSCRRNKLSTRPWSCWPSTSPI